MHEPTRKEIFFIIDQSVLLKIIILEKLLKIEIIHLYLIIKKINL
jgi:hypothetical protein